MDFQIQSKNVANLRESNTNNHACKIQCKSVANLRERNTNNHACKTNDIDDSLYILDPQHYIPKIHMYKFDKKLTFPVYALQRDGR